ncbi:MAG: hypothetical protein ACRDQG_04675 [Pseudonocardiaceae bacterium]
MSCRAKATWAGRATGTANRDQLTVVITHGDIGREVRVDVSPQVQQRLRVDTAKVNAIRDLAVAHQALLAGLWTGRALLSPAATGAVAALIAEEVADRNQVPIDEPVRTELREAFPWSEAHAYLHERVGYRGLTALRRPPQTDVLTTLYQAATPTETSLLDSLAERAALMWICTCPQRHDATTTACDTCHTVHPETPSDTALPCTAGSHPPPQT